MHAVEFLSSQIFISVPSAMQKIEVNCAQNNATRVRALSLSLFLLLSNSLSPPSLCEQEILGPET
jgi:hypothetical protein